MAPELGCNFAYLEGVEIESVFVILWLDGLNVGLNVDSQYTDLFLHMI